MKATYKTLVYLAYGYFILVGLAWFLFPLMATPSVINYEAALIIVTFGLQCYFKHKLTNLLMGIIGLFVSIIVLLNIIPLRNAWLLGFGFINIILSGVLIMSFHMLNKVEE